MILTRVHPVPAESRELDAPGTRDRLLELYRPPRADWLRLNLVLSVNGSAVGADGTSESLTSRADRRILGVIRELADAVLVGAGSVRVEGYQMPRRSRLAVLTASGDLSGHRLGDNLGRVLVIGPAAALDRARETAGNAEFVTIPASNGRASVIDVVGTLRAAGLRSIVCEGGPTLAGQVIDAGIADEICLTTSPRLTPSPLAALGSGYSEHRALSLTQLIVDEESGLYARWAVGAPRATAR